MSTVDAAPAPPHLGGSILRVGSLGAAVHVRAHGVRLDQIRALWARCLVGDADTPPAAEITIPDSPLPLSAEMVMRLTSRINLAGIEHQAGRSVMLHAAGLALPDGSVLGLVAPSGTGKTTAAIELAHAGLGYVTDETLAIADDLSVLPFAKPLSLVVPGAEAKEARGPDELGLTPCATDGLQLARLVVLARDPGHEGPPALRRLLLPEALTLLVSQSSSLPRLVQPLRRLEEVAAAVGGVWLLEYAEIADAVPLLMRHLGVAAGRSVLQARYVAEPVVDVLDHGEGLAVLTGDRLLHLSGLGRAVWQAAQAGSTFVGVHDAAVAMIGPHEDSEALVREALDGLVELGLVSARR